MTRGKGGLMQLGPAVGLHTTRRLDLSASDVFAQTKSPCEVELPRKMSRNPIHAVAHIDPRLSLITGQSFIEVVR